MHWVSFFDLRFFRIVSNGFLGIRVKPAYYCDSVVTLPEDALTDRDLVHRQTASTIVKHLALGVAGLGCEDSMLHLANPVWPNI
jgi:hypothetical protein